MPLALYLDEQAQSSIAAGLRARGVDVRTVQDDGRTGGTDEQVLARAEELGRVVFTRDDDFLVLAQDRQADGAPFPGVIYAHPLRASVGQCIADLELLAKACEPSELADQVVFLPL